MGMENGAADVKCTMVVTKYIYICMELKYDPMIPLLGLHLKNWKQGQSWRDTCTPMFLAAFFTVAQSGNGPNVYWWVNG